jgi:hypothetical protein
MDTLTSIDKVVNFVPQLPLTLANKANVGSSGLALLPIIAVGYVGGCVVQGAAAAYAVAKSGASTEQSIVTGAIVTMIPPIVKAFKIFYGKKNYS